MQANVFWITGPWQGRLGVVLRPQGGDWLRDETTAWRETGIGASGGIRNTRTPSLISMSASTKPRLTFREAEGGNCLCPLRLGRHNSRADRRKGEGVSRSGAGRPGRVSLAVALTPGTTKGCTVFFT